MTWKSLTTKPGTFRATCRKGAWLPVDQLTLEERAEVDRREAERIARNEYHSLYRYDHKRKAEVASVECRLDTADRDEYLAHMARFHGQRPRNVMWADHSTQSLSNRARGKWRTPKAPPEGTPVRYSTKELAMSVVTCPCGFVMERDGSSAGELFIREHLELCAAEAGAA